MNRLQKKCLIATAGFHLLLVLVILFGAAFFTSHPKPDETQLLTVIPANLIDAAFNSGVKAAQLPAPTPVVQPLAPQPTPTPPQPQPVVTPPTPAPQPTPTLVEKVKEFFTPETPKLPPDDTELVEKPAKPQPHKINVDLTKHVVRTVPKETPDTSEADDAREAKRLAKARAKAIANAARAIKENSSSATTVEMPGAGSVSYANYASVVKSIYEQAWTPPDDTSSDDANTKVSVTIGSDGTVISSHVLDPSGDARVDGSVQRTLDRVTFIAPFPDGAKEKQRTFIINFNLKAKRMLG
jgi:TonB family protein